MLFRNLTARIARDTHLPIRVRAAEQTRQTLETLGIGNRIVDFLQDPLVIG